MRVQWGTAAAAATVLVLAAGVPVRAQAAVTRILADPAAVVTAAAAQPRSTRHEVTFTFTAEAPGRVPAAGAEVHFYVGRARPGRAPVHWYAAGTPGADRYVAYADAITGQDGRARIRLYGEPAGTEVWVGLRVGGLDTYDAAANRMLAAATAWWAAPGSRPAPGTEALLDPLMRAVPPGVPVHFSLEVLGPQGPEAGARVRFGAEGTAVTDSLGRARLTLATRGRDGTYALPVQVSRNGQAASGPLQAAYEVSRAARGTVGGGLFSNPRFPWVAGGILLAVFAGFWIRATRKEP
ncbi:exported protein of unknown function [Candidatus Hydrogenisulfobacillus filiaventi]|uniref:Uncharacterized protein n=1 Tax=Candidatus Hydrogenisulfobacillus filiaventi TaxID=2707344 RepID=A0A6F8ZKG0_9FIRM|nr:hypothetical protein [Bacillota bacterium]CAB1130092.1 exported protein of unknown function [Candidatus Hydrogenisulfobacillus filiaventi]